MTMRRVALLTAGGFAPCLSASVGYLIDNYTKSDPDVEIIAYQNGYHGLLTGNYIVVDEAARKNALNLTEFGGSPIGNSRVKLTNKEDLLKRGLIPEGVDPLGYAADKLKEDHVDVLHTIGGDDTNTTAADLAQYLHEHNYELTVVGLPKTIDNDVYPIRQSLGAWTAAEQGATFAANIIGEHRVSPRMLIVHEVMGRNCGYLTAQTAKVYRERLNERNWVPSIGLSKERWDIHAVYIPEESIDIEAESKRLKAIMDELGNVNIFLSEGAGVDDIVREMEEAGEEVQKDAFGHVKLDTINPGNWFAGQFAKRIGAEKVMVQKSGYFARSAAANKEDLELIKSMCDLAVESAHAGKPGVIGQDEDNGDKLSVIDFARIKGGKPFDVDTDWFAQMLEQIGQPRGKALAK
ncbi:pyrophosphate--fructose-6-phosphate 1-phosphotransferase [Winkia neuii]|uniref:pyrophosphate--fructose-6-phosphate 1-phosphotransferase n=1 Tax=Winkia neuii TaxID=33007 RepID=UPI000409911B|nr:pyrophosphate--fructose-6-phosphate 1-phosphotransferase [Winkia neuii]